MEAKNILKLLQSQRDCVIQPRVASPTSYPGYGPQIFINPERVVAGFVHGVLHVFGWGATLSGFDFLRDVFPGETRTTGTLFTLRTLVPRNPGLCCRIPLGFASSV